MSIDTAQFEKALEQMHSAFSAVRTGRANPAMVENISVTAYESQMKLQELASISTPEPQTLVIQPWDGSVIQAIESALRDSELDVSPVVDGELIRISFPPLTEEKRTEFVKRIHEKAENARVAIRKTREQLLKDFKQQQKNGDISEDEYFREEKDVQATVDSYNKKIEEAVEQKEKELMTI